MTISWPFRGSYFLYLQDRATQEENNSSWVTLPRRMGATTYRNFGNHPLDVTASHPKRLEFSWRWPLLGTECKLILTFSISSAYVLLRATCLMFWLRCVIVPVSCLSYCDKIKQIKTKNFLYNKTNQMHQFHKFILPWNSTCFGQFLCPSSGVYSLYTRQWYMSYWNFTNG